MVLTLPRSPPAIRSLRGCSALGWARPAGVAPRARVAAYKACFLKPGDTRASCATSDLVQAIDAAVADGVDIINYAVGSADLDPAAPDAIALLNAADAGIFASVAVG